MFVRLSRSSCSLGTSLTFIHGIAVAATNERLACNRPQPACTSGVCDSDVFLARYGETMGLGREGTASAMCKVTYTLSIASYWPRSSVFETTPRGMECRQNKQTKGMRVQRRKPSTAIDTEALSSNHHSNHYHNRHHQPGRHLQPAISLAICMGKPASASVVQNADVTRGLLESQHVPFDCFSQSTLLRLEGWLRHRVRCATKAGESSATQLIGRYRRTAELATRMELHLLGKFRL